MNEQLNALRQYFMSGATQSFAFRLAQLEALKKRGVRPRKRAGTSAPRRS